MLPWPTYHQPLQRWNWWNCVWVQFRKSLCCLLLRSVCPESGLGFIGCFWLEGTSGVLSSSLLCQAGSAVRPDEVSESFNPVWYWKPPRMETTQPLWATCSHVWLASGKKSFHYNHSEWTSPVSDVSLSIWEPLYRYWRVAVRSPQSFSCSRLNRRTAGWCSLLSTKTLRAFSAELLPTLLSFLGKS